MGVDLLDMVYRLEKTFSINIERGDLIPEFIVNDTQGKYVVDGKLNEQGLEEIKKRMPSADLSSFGKNPTIQSIATILTVKSICDLVEQKIREKNEGVNGFPNVLLQVNNSVLETLAKQFNIADPSKIDTKFRLNQLADLSVSPLSTAFWKRFYRIQRNDLSELKAIKVYVLSRELVSAWNTLYLSSVITISFFILLLIGGFFWDGVLYFLTALFVPGIILFGLRSIVNRQRSYKASRVTVGEIIDYLADQRQDRSVRADGLPYSRTEIEQCVAKILCEVLAIELEEIKPESRLIQDLGAA